MADKKIFFVVPAHTRFAVAAFVLLAGSAVVLGCSHVAELSKTIWGSSTRALEKARAKALTKTFRCEFDGCFAKVLKLTETPAPTPTPTPTPAPSVSPDKAKGKSSAKKASATNTTNSKMPTASGGPQLVAPADVKPILELFLQDKARRHIVVMGVPTSIDTTEVGIFFEPAGDGLTRVEISSLSTNAKTRAAELIFPELEKFFAVVPPSAGEKH